jgi:hypothetical protein
VNHETIRTRNGEYSLRVAGKHLHSAYDPRREATRLADRFQLEAHVRVLTIIGEGIPYFSRELAEKHPSLRVIALTYGDVPDYTEKRSASIERIPLTNPGTSEVRRLLRSRFSPVEATQVQAFLWPAAAECIPHWAEVVQAGVVEALRDGHSELATVASFGHLWIRNAIRRNLLMDTVYTPDIHTDTVVALSGGPSGTDSFSDILRHRREVTVVGVSSVAVAASHSGLSPDLLVHTDAGFWAKRYRYPLPTVASFRSTPPVHAADRREILFRSGWIGEDLAADAEEWIPLPEQPTVAATLLAFVDRVTPGGVPFFLSGFDLASRDLITHARPHPNDLFISRSADRLSPEVTIRALRSGLFSDDSPLRWHDGTPAFRTEALKSFHEPLATLIDTISQGRPVRHMTESPVWPRAWRSRGFHPEKGECTVTLRRLPRPPRQERKRHMLQVLQKWADSPEEQLLLHLAPVELLSAVRGDASSDSAVASGRRAIERFRRWVEHG